MEEGKKSNNSLKIPFNQYAAGASVANAPPFIVNFVLNSMNVEISLTTIVLIYLSALGGSVLGGYLMSRRVRLRDPRTGVIMGFLSFAFYTLLMLLSGFPGWINDFVLITAFVIGGLLGYEAWEMMEKPMVPIGKAG